MLVRGYVGVWLLCVAQGFAVPFEGVYNLDIIHYNDFHARFEETAVESVRCVSDDGRCVGGLARLYAACARLLQQRPHALLLNAGDSFQGTYWYTLLKWNVTQRFLNLLPHDAHAIGNHEFDDGPGGLAPYLARLQAPVVAANMDAADEPALHGLYQPHVVVERQGRKIGIIGLITPDTAKLAYPGNVKFSACGESAAREAAILRERQVDIVVLLSHCGLDVDREIAANFSENIDVIVGGHTHSLLWAGPAPAPSGEPVAGPYPVLVQRSGAPSQHKVLIVQASAFTKYLGSLRVQFDFRGHVQAWEGGAIFLNRSHPEDAHVKEMLAPYAAEVRAAAATLVGASAAPLAREGCAAGQCALGSLITDAFLHYAQRKLPENHPQVALYVSSGIPASLPDGNITRGDVFEVFPYRDRVESFQLQGRYLLAALELGLGQGAELTPSGQLSAPNLLQIAGMKVLVNMTAPAGSRVVRAGVVGTPPQPETQVEPQPKITLEAPLDPEAHYGVVTAAFLADGGFGFQMFEHRTQVAVAGRDQDALTDYLEAHSPYVPPPADERITIYH